MPSSARYRCSAWAAVARIGRRSVGSAARMAAASFYDVDCGAEDGAGQVVARRDGGDVDAGGAAELGDRGVVAGREVCLDERGDADVEADVPVDRI
jgi:hypothetical protein